MAGAVLDASAVLAYLNREPGAEIVADLLAEGASISAVSLAEVLSAGADRGVAAARLIVGLRRSGSSTAPSLSNL